MALNLTCPLLELPAELRNHIYALVKADMPSRPREKVGIIDAVVVSHPLTRTCRQIRDESLSFFQDIDFTNTADIRAQVFDFRFGPLLDFVGRIIPDEEGEGSTFLDVDLHLVNPTEGTGSTKSTMVVVRLRTLISCKESQQGLHHRL